MYGYLIRRMTGPPRLSPPKAKPSVFTGDSSPPRPLMERAEVIDDFGSLPFSYEYCINGEKEGWLKYLGHYRDRHGVIHRYLLIS